MPHPVELCRGAALLARAAGWEITVDLVSIDSSNGMLLDPATNGRGIYDGFIVNPVATVGLAVEVRRSSARARHVLGAWREFAASQGGQGAAASRCGSAAAAVARRGGRLGRGSSFAQLDGPPRVAQEAAPVWERFHPAAIGVVAAWRRGFWSPWTPTWPLTPTCSGQTSCSECAQPSGAARGTPHADTGSAGHGRQHLGALWTVRKEAALTD